MKQILKVHNVNDYARYIGAPELHPLVSVIHYDELEHCHHSLNNYDVYGIFIADEMLEELVYGLTTYDLHRHALMCVAPGQIGGKADFGEEIQTKGWALLFDPELLHGTGLERQMLAYTYFSYNTNEALLMSDEQRQTIVALLETLREELKCDDQHTRPIVTALLQLVLEHIARFYAKQLSTEATKSNDLLTRFESLLGRYYSDGVYREHGLPTVKYCAQELFLSPNYFGDLVKEMTGDTAGNTIRRFVMKRAQELLISGHTISQTADELGFDYPQHFTRMFKRHYGLSPSDYLKQRKHQ
ncbi:MAG: AraC family transcriptional regulator [Muribaculaceae bacterium]|nr:AraC family transcriptional regulator [Muribaculaceae bacterium]